MYITHSVLYYNCHCRGSALSLVFLLCFVVLVFIDLRAWWSGSSLVTDAPGEDYLISWTI